MQRPERPHAEPVSGAVYLLNRKKSEIRSMLKCRTDYRAEIKEDAEVVDASSD